MLNKLAAVIMIGRSILDIPASLFPAMNFSLLDQTAVLKAKTSSL